MFKFDWLRGKSPSTNGPPMESWFDPGVVCPDGTVMWAWQGDDPSSNWAGEADPVPNLPALASAAHSSEQIHYHYHRFGTGPWVFLGLQVSLAIALLLILSPGLLSPDTQSPAIDSSLDSMSNP